MKVGRELSWCRPNLKFRKPYAPFFYSQLRGQVNKAHIAADRVTSMASSWIENPTDKDRLLIKQRMQLSRATVGALSLIR